jgi:hypothetical protein
MKIMLIHLFASVGKFLKNYLKNDPVKLVGDTFFFYKALENWFYQKSNTLFH